MWLLDSETSMATPIKPGLRLQNWQHDKPFHNNGWCHGGFTPCYNIGVAYNVLSMFDSIFGQRTAWGSAGASEQVRSLCPFLQSHSLLPCFDKPSHSILFIKHHLLSKTGPNSWHLNLSCLREDVQLTAADWCRRELWQSLRCWVDFLFQRSFVDLFV